MVSGLSSYPASYASHSHPRVTAVHTIIHTSVSASAGTGSYASSSSDLASVGYPSHSGYGSNGTSKRSNGTAAAHGTNLSRLLRGTGVRNHTFLAPSGSGYSYANACNQAFISWQSRYVGETYVTASIYRPSNGTMAPPASDVYTLCDGIPRMRAGVTTPAKPFVSLQQWITEKGSAPSQIVMHNRPNCSIEPHDCVSLMSSYSSRHNVPTWASLGPIHTSYEPLLLDDYPRCQTNTVPCGTPGADCALAGSGIQLFYWPQTWAGGYCGDQKEIVTMAPTIPGKPNTATWQNYTFTSPTVYVKYDAISAHDICGNNFGPTLRSSFIPMPSESVTSKIPYFMTNLPWAGPSGLMYIGREVGISNAVLSGWPGINPDYGDAGMPVTYPDLDPATVPAIPYFQREMLDDQRCYYGGCPTMEPWNYFPRLNIPDQARSLNSEWLTCTLAWGAM